ncbi:MAG: Nramp family divalent metal transporter [Pseudomonadales bacterium]
MSRPESTAQRAAASGRLRDRLGPGLVFAAAAVGTSHVVQSTRAGADFGLTLGLLILAVCALKYPLFRFAAEYAAATGENLIRGYGRQGRSLVLIMFVTSAIEAVAATAGVSLVSASILKWITGVQIGDVPAAVGLLVATALIVAVGRYRLLESLTGILVLLFSGLTLITTLACLPALASADDLLPAFPLTTENWSFAIAVSGWMPIGNTAAMMLAAWILAKTRGGERSVTAARFDFNLGYLASVVLALCFLVIGAVVLHGSGERMPGASGAFVTTFVGLYTRAIGGWSTVLVSLAALAVMYSTLLAIVDGFPRMLGEFAAELSGAHGEDRAAAWYLPAMLVVVLAAGALLYFLLGAFAAFIDVVTFTGFLAAPVIAWANERVIRGDNVPLDVRPGAALVRWNRLAVGLLTLATLGYVYLRWV